MKYIPKKGSKFNPEIISFMKHKIETNSVSDLRLMELVNKKYKTLFSYKQIRNAVYRHGLCGYRTHQRNQKGRPLMDEMKNDRGYTFIKIANTESFWKNWVRKHIWVWEQAHGKIPKDHKIIFLDNDKSNCELDNLAIVTNNELLRLTQLGLRTNDKELTKTGLTVVRHQTEIYKKLSHTVKRKNGETLKAYQGRVYNERRKEKRRLQFFLGVYEKAEN